MNKNKIQMISDEDYSSFYTSLQYILMCLDLD